MHARARPLMHTCQRLVWVGSDRCVRACMSVCCACAGMDCVVAVVDYAAERAVADRDLTAAVRLVRAYVSKLQKAQLAAEQALAMCDWCGHSRCGEHALHGRAGLEKFARPARSACAALWW